MTGIRVSGLGAARLAAALQMLSQIGAAPSPEAVADLYSELRRRAPRWIARQFRVVVAAIGYQELADIVEDVVQQTVIAACLGTSRCNSVDARAALAWCRTVVVRGFRAEIRSRFSGNVNSPESTRGYPSADVWGRGDLSDVIAVRRLAAVVEAKSTSLRATHMRKVMSCYLEWLAGASIEQQIIKYGLKNARRKGPRSRRDLSKARARVYQYHRRGKLLARRLLGTMES